MKLERVERINGNVFAPKDELRVRYSRINGDKKNTLLTLNRKGVVFFGIARCNFAGGDKFSKKTGKAIAVERLLSLIGKFPDYHWDKLGLFLIRNMMAGWCRVDRFVGVLKHFRNIDEKIDEERQRRYDLQRKNW